MRMRTALCVTAAAGVLLETPAFAQVQGVDLNGQFQCVASCAGEPGTLAFVTQNGWELNLVDDAGRASRAWVNYPGRMWVDRAQEGAIYSQDGMTIQFDHGAVWQRYVELPPPLLVPRRRLAPVVLR